MTNRRAASIALRFGIVLGCLGYVLWDVEVDSFVHALSRYGVVASLSVVIVGFAAYLMTGARLSWFMDERPGIGLCTAASLLALGVNNIVPAKLGELAKVAYLSRRTEIEMTRWLAVVFWERFFDLNALLLLGLLATLVLDIAAGVVPLAVLVVCLWVTVSILRLRPGMAARLIAWVPVVALRGLLAQLNVQVQTGFAVRPLAVLCWCTLSVWALYVIQVVLLLLWAAQFDLSLDQVLVVFVVVSLAMMLPAGPGGIGVVEAAMVLGLGWFGVGKSEALAAAVFLHLVQFVPTTLFAVIVLARSRISLRRPLEAR